MCSLPVHNPCVPFVAYIPGGINVGTKIKIRGVMPHMSDRFSINLECGSGSAAGCQDDIALHLSVRPSECAIVRNSFEYRSWSREERYGSCPIFRGQPYDIDIHVEHSRYSIRINGHHFCDFNHRITMARISHIRISGDTMIHYVGNEGVTYVMHPPPTIVHVPAHKPVGAVSAIVGGIIGGVVGASIHSRPHHHHRPHHGHHHGPHFGPHHHRGGHHC